MEGRRDHFGGKPLPLPFRSQHDRVQRLVSVALQSKHCPVGADLRIIFDSVTPGDSRHGLPVFGPRPSIYASCRCHPDSRVHQALAVIAESDVSDLEISRRKRASRAALRRDSIEMQPAGLLHGNTSSSWLVQNKFSSERVG